MAFVRQGSVRGIRRPVTQNNGAPRGYGQVSPYLDRPQEPQQEFYDRSTPEEEEEEYRRNAYARTQPVEQPRRLEEEQEPAYLTALNDLEQESSTARNNAQSLFDTRSAAKDALRKQMEGAESGSYQGSSSSYDLSDLDGAVPREQEQLADGYTISGSIGGGITGAPDDWANRKLTMDDILGGLADGYVSGGSEAETDPTGLPSRPPQGLAADGSWAGYGTGNIAGAENVQWGDTSRLRGANTAEWGPGGTEGYEDLSHKNTFLKIASRYDPTQPGAARTMMADEEFQYYFPAARLIEHPKGDQIDFGDGNPVDVLINAVEGGSGEAWAFQTGGGAAPSGPSGFAQASVTGQGQLPANTDPQQLIAIATQLGLDGNQIQELLQQLMLEEEEQQALVNSANAFLPLP